MTPFQVEIPRRSRHCAIHEELFGPNVNYHSILLEEERGGYMRKDFCVECWKREGKEIFLKQTAIHWQSKVPAKKQRSDLPKKRNERALALLKEIHQEQEPELMEEAFVLALLLARSRIILLRQELPEGNLYEVADSEEMLVVPRMDLSRFETDKVQKRLAEKFNG